MHAQDGTILAGATIQPWPHSSTNGAAAGTGTLYARQVLERKLLHHHRDLARVLAGERDALLKRLAATRREAAGDRPLAYIRRGVSAYRTLVDTAVTEVSAWAARLWPLVERIVDANPALSAREVKALGFHVRRGTVLRSLGLDPVEWEKEAFRGLGGLSGCPRQGDQEVIEALMSVQTARAVEAFDEVFAHGLHAFGLAVDEHFLLRSHCQSAQGETGSPPSPPACTAPIPLEATTPLSWSACLPSFPARRVNVVAEAIRAAVVMLIEQLGQEPDLHQVWNALAVGKVQGFVVTNVDRDTLKIEGRGLNRESFRKRWESYTRDQG
jgi:hypothetical protein